MNFLNFLTQSYGKLALLDVIIIVIYMLLCLYIGFRKAGKIRNIRDFALGSESISTFVLVCTLYATHLGAGMMFGTLENIKKVGMLFAVSVLLAPLGWMLKIWVFANNIDQFRGCISVSDIMDRLYGWVGKHATNFMSVVVAVGITAAQGTAAGYTIHYFTNIPIHYGTIISISVLVVYAALGGVRAVALTDVLQFTIFYVAIPCLCALGLHKVNGFAGIAQLVPEAKLHVDLNTSTLPEFIGFITYAMIITSTGSAFIQRFLMSRDSAQLTKALKIVAGLDFIMAITLCILGFVIASLFPDTDSSKASFLNMTTMLLPIGLKGIVIIGLLAIIMSTADSWLNVTAVICAHDIGKHIWPGMDNKSEVLLARLTTLVVGFLAIALALTGKSILELIWLVDNFCAPVIFVPLVIGFLRFRTNGLSFVAAATVGIILMSTGAYIQGDFDTVSLLLGLFGSAIGLFGMHYYQISTGALERRTIIRARKDSFSLLKYIRKLIKKLGKITPKSLLIKINRSIAQDPPNYYTFAPWGIIYCLYPLILLLIAGDDDTINSFSLELGLRMAGAVGCVILLFHEMWTANIREKYLGLYWYALLLCCLPMLGTYGLIVRSYDWVWSIHASMAIFILVAFTSYRATVLMTILGVILGALLSLTFDYQLTLGKTSVAVKLNESIIATMYLTLTVGISREIFWRLQKNASLSTIDALTSLHNKRYLNLNLDNIVEDAKMEGHELSVIMIDMDHFGQINKQYGHQAGDAVLKELGKRLKQNLLTEDVCARYGGEEFIILIPEADIAEAYRVANRLLEMIRSVPFYISSDENDGKTIHCTTSIGIAELRQGEDVRSLISRADYALKFAKTQGRDRVVSAENEMEQMATAEA